MSLFYKIPARHESIMDSGKQFDPNVMQLRNMEANTMANNMETNKLDANKMEANKMETNKKEANDMEANDMKANNRKSVDKRHIEVWIHRNARELELAKWNYYFENGNKEDVINALMHYQNADGGFGHGIDPDNWNYNSIPYGLYYVLEVLDEIEFYDMQHPIYAGIKKYLDCHSNFPEGWIFTVPTNENYPHASFYNYDAEYNKIESRGIHLRFCAFILEHYRESILYPSVLDLIKTLIEGLKEDQLGDMGPSGYISLITAMKQVNLEGYDYDRLEEEMIRAVNKSIQRDPAQWSSYGYRPSDYIKSKDSIFYPGNEELVETELDFLVDTLPEHDVWPISWCWFENYEKYPKEFIISENWAKGYKAIEKAMFLKRFGRLNP